MRGRAQAIAPSAAYQLDYCGGATTSFHPQPAAGKRYADGKQTGKKKQSCQWPWQCLPGPHQMRGSSACRRQRERALRWLADGSNYLTNCARVGPISKTYTRLPRQTQCWSDKLGTNFLRSGVGGRGCIGGRYHSQSSTGATRRGESLVEIARSPTFAVEETSRPRH